MKAPSELAKDSKAQKAKLVIIGASAGGISTLTEEVLPVLLESQHAPPIVVVLHLPAGDTHNIEELLQKASGHEAQHIADKTRLAKNQLYLAPPDYHVLFESEMRASLCVSEPVNFTRPSIDVAFNSAARELGDKVIGVLLTGASDDGAQGLKALHEKGGLSIVQAPATAQMPYMPKSALKLFSPDAIYSPQEIGQFLASLECEGEL